MENEDEKKSLDDFSRRHEREVNLTIHEKEEESKINNNWESCCLTVDRRAVQYFTTLGVSSVIICLCVVKLSGDLPCQEQNGWIAMLTFVIGIYIKSPSL